MEINNFISSRGTVVEQVWGRGRSYVRSIREYAALTAPFYQAPPPLQRPTFYTQRQLSVFRLKNSAFLGPFLSNFGKISAPNTLISAQIRSQDPGFRSVDLTSENPCDTCPPPKKKTNKQTNPQDSQGCEHTCLDGLCYAVTQWVQSSRPSRMFTSSADMTQKEKWSASMSMIPNIGPLWV